MLARVLSSATFRGCFPEQGGLKAQLGDRDVEVVGTVPAGASFAADGNVIMTETNFRRLVLDSRASDAALAALRLTRGANMATVRDRLTKLLSPGLRVLTHTELVQWEKRFWDQQTPIGITFAFGSLMGLIVGPGYHSPSRRSRLADRPVGQWQDHAADADWCAARGAAWTLRRSGESTRRSDRGRQGSDQAQNWVYFSRSSIAGLPDGKTERGHGAGAQPCKKRQS